MAGAGGVRCLCAVVQPLHPRGIPLPSTVIGAPFGVCRLDLSRQHPRILEEGVDDSLGDFAAHRGADRGWGAGVKSLRTFPGIANSTGGDGDCDALSLYACDGTAQFLSEVISWPGGLRSGVLLCHGDWRRLPGLPRRLAHLVYCLSHHGGSCSFYSLRPVVGGGFRPRSPHAPAPLGLLLFKSGGELLCSAQASCCGS